MAVSKRTRFEVLRRDNYTCRYCRSTDGRLTVDHVTPVALGGSDSPENLVACCADCNSGKTSTSVTEETVAAVAEDALRWSAAMEQAAQVMRAKTDERHIYLAAFYDEWPQHRYLPNNIEATVDRFFDAGLPVEVLKEVTRIAGNARGVDNRAAYFAGVGWKRVRAMQDIAAEIIAGASSG